MAQVVSLSAALPVLNEVLRNLQAALDGVATMPDPAVQTSLHPRPAIVHLDWVGAGQAMVRATIPILAVGMTWVVTGWRGGPYMMIGTSVMISIFSAFDNPAKMMRNVIFWGQLLGAMAALACHWLAWPFANSELGIVLLMMPFILFGG